MPQTDPSAREKLRWLYLLIRWWLLGPKPMARAIVNPEPPRSSDHFADLTIRPSLWRRFVHGERTRTERVRVRFVRIEYDARGREVKPPRA